MCRIGEIEYISMVPIEINGESIAHPMGSVDMIVMCALELGSGEECEPRMLVDGFPSANGTVAICFTMIDGSTRVLGDVGFGGSNWKGTYSQLDYNLDVVLAYLGFERTEIFGGVESLAGIEVLVDNPYYWSFVSI